ncbi:MAG TPA: hypothetical protein DDY98_08075 [Ruminococcaceae bacterium]|nr:hypothetical protein [Oscillospiraceae bacterium]
MKKKQNTNEEINALRKTLEPLNKTIETPDLLSAQSITRLLEEKQPKQKKGKVIALNTARAVAAVLAVAVGVTSAVHLYNVPRVRNIPTAIASAESPLSGNTQKDITDYFTALKAKYESEQIKLFNSSDGMKSYDTAAEEYATGAKSTGTTNTQEENVDEQDKIENDGRYLYYVAQNETVYIIDTETMTKQSTIEPYSQTVYNTEIYYKDNRLVVLGSFYGDGRQTTAVTVYDVTDRTSPQRIKTVEQDGALFGSRLVNNRLVVISDDYVPIYDLKTNGGYAKYEDVVPSTRVNGGERTAIDASSVVIMPNGESNSYLVISTLDLDTLANSHPHTSAILGAGDNIYCTDKCLFVTATEYKECGSTDDRVIETVWANAQNTKIYSFSFLGATVSLEHSATVPGTLHNSFSLDSEDGTLRVATTYADEQGRSATRITVLDESLREIGKIEGIAPNESIQSVRYIGQYGYAVTFERTDPLFVIDFSDKTNPKIVGELKLPGFSSYLHPFNGYLIGVGTDGDENGTTNGMKVSLFDISDPTNPKEIDRVVFSSANATVGYDHHAFLDYGSKNRFGLSYEQYSANGSDSLFSTFAVENGKLKLLSTFTNREKNGKVKIYSPDGATNLDIATDSRFGIDRGTYIGDTLYTASYERICAWPFDGGECLGKAELN